MTFSEVQPFFKAQIDVDPTLGDLNCVVLYDPNKSQEQQRAAITAKIKACGFCVEMGMPHIPADERQTNQGGASFSRGLMPVYVAEDRNLPHTPAGTLLVDYVEAAINSRNDTRNLTKTHSISAAESDNGLIIWELIFSVQIQNTQKLAVIVDAGLTQIADAAGNTFTTQ